MASLESTLNLDRESSVMESVGKYAGAALGLIAGLDVAATTGSILGKVVAVLGGTVIGARVGKKFGQAAS